MNKYFIILISYIFIISNCTSQNYRYNDNKGQDGLTLLESKNDLIKLSFAIEEFELKDIEVEKTMMSKIIWGDAFLPGKEGFPELPSITKNFVIPNDAKIEVQYKINAEETLNDIIVHPAAKTPGELELSYDAKRGTVYSENSFYPKSPILVSYSEIRGHKIARVSIVPFQYNPVTKELLIHKNLDFELNIKSSNFKYADQRFRSVYWDEIISNIICNFKDLPTVGYNKTKSQNLNGCDLVILTPNNPDFLSWADTLKRFRDEQGIRSKIVTTEEIGGNEEEVIKSYFENVYQTWDPVPSGILIIGDHRPDDLGVVSKIHKDYPSFSMAFLSDNYYTDMTGNEFPDFAIGRISVREEFELKDVVNKIMEYERNPPIEENFYEEPAFVVGYQSDRWFQMNSESISGYLRSALGKKPYRIDSLYSYLSPNNPATDPWSFAPNSHLVESYFGQDNLGYLPPSPNSVGPLGNGGSQDIINAFNKGSFMIFLRDHGTSSGYWVPRFETRHIPKLNNKRYPTHLFSIACSNGAFNWEDKCFIEALLVKKNGGILSGTASTEVTFSYFNDCLMWGMTDFIWPGFLPDYGNTQFKNNSYFPAFALASSKYYINTLNWVNGSAEILITSRIWHHFGDPFTTVHTALPSNNSVNHLFSLSTNSDKLDVEAEPYSLVCLSKDGEIFDRAFTNEIGKAELCFPPQDLSTKLKLVITKHNFFRYEEDLYVVPEEGSFLAIKDIIIRDENGNNQIDYNELVNIDLRIRNYGNSTSEPMHITVSGNEEHYKILSDLQIEIDSISQNQQVILSNLITFKTDIDVPDQLSSNININIQNQSNLPNLTVPIIVNAPKISFSPLEFIEVEGNGNLFIDPGESYEMQLIVKNNGHSSFPISTLECTSPSEHINIVLEDNHIPELINGAETTLIYQTEVSLSADSVSLFQIDHWLNNEILPKHDQQFFFTGKVIEDFETGDFEKYPWYLDGEKDWEITSDYVESGEYAAKISGLNDNEEASLNLDYYFGADYHIYFSAQVSTDFGHDNLTFWVNDSLYQTISQFQLFGLSAKNKVFVPKGLNKLTWKYTKDESGSGGLDAIWLDNLILPPIDSIPSLGIKENRIEKNITFSPSPAKSTISITNNYSETINEIEIISIDSKTSRYYYQYIKPYNTTIVNIESLKSGFYIIKFICTDDDVFTDKLIIKK